MRERILRLEAEAYDAPLLKYPDFKQAFTIQTNASNVGVDGVLTQVQNGEEHPVAYYSRSSNKAERGYSVIEREALGIIESVKAFRPYIYGTKFTLQTDHKPLKYIMDGRYATDKSARWYTKLQEYEYEVQYRKGSCNANADYFSRLPHAADKAVQTAVVESAPDDIGDAQRQDKLLGSVIEFLESGVLPTAAADRAWILGSADYYKLLDGTLCYERHDATGESAHITVVPKILVPEVLSLIHESAVGGHLAFKPTLAEAGQCFCKSCPLCQTGKDRR